MVMIFLSGCSNNSVTSIITNGEVNFSIAHPKNWTYTEDKNDSHSDTENPNYDTMVTFILEDTEETFFIGGFVTPFYPNQNATKRSLTTKDKVQISVYEKVGEEVISVYYSYNTETKIKYYAGLIMSNESYKKNKKTIESIVKSFKLIS